MQPGDNIGKYRLVSPLGRGGMGEVWLAHATGYGGFTKQVVLKTLLPEYEHDPLYVDMLTHEARTCAKLSHPNLIEVFDFSKHGATYLLAMEYVHGESLSQILRAAQVRNWPIPTWFALRIVWECARGLEHAHDQGVIHCDLSPSNVMVTYTGVTKLLDFGVAHSSEDGDKADRLKGKLSYMAPERIRSLATDRRTDVYSLGVMLYLLFVSRLPFSAQSDAELVEQKMAPPVRPSHFGPMDTRIEHIILRAMAADPAERYQSVPDLLADLQPALDGELGAYGQHDAAGFMARLFDGAKLPTIPPPPPPPALAIAVAPRAAQRALTIPARPTGTPRVVVTPADIEVEIELTPEPVEPPPVEEPRTTVQSLFGASRSSAPSLRDFECSRIFDRGSLGTPERREPDNVAWPWPASLTKSG